MAQRRQHFLEFRNHLANQLPVMRIFLARIAFHALARATDREALLVEQAADLADQDHVLTLVVAAIAARTLPAVLLVEDLPCDTAGLAKFL